MAVLWRKILRNHGNNCVFCEQCSAKQLPNYWQGKVLLEAVAVVCLVALLGEGGVCLFSNEVSEDCD